MKVRHWITGIVLLLLMAVAFVGLLRTRDLGQAPETKEAGKAPAGKKLLARSAPAAQRPLVDQSPLQTARRDGALAYTQEEKDLARQAEKVAMKSTWHSSMLSALRRKIRPHSLPRSSNWPTKRIRHSKRFRRIRTASTS